MTLCVFWKKVITILYTIFNFKPEAVVFLCTLCLRAWIESENVEVDP